MYQTYPKINSLGGANYGENTTKYGMGTSIRENEQ